MMFVADIPLSQLLHDGFMKLLNHFQLRLFRGNFVGEFDEAVEVITLHVGHPVAAVDEGSFDHFEFFSRDHGEGGVEVFDNEVLKFAI
jgi:hypothetical protein